VYIDTGSPVPNIPSKSRGLADENKKKTFHGMEMIRNKRIVLALPCRTLSLCHVQLQTNVCKFVREFSNYCNLCHIHIYLNLTSILYSVLLFDVSCNISCICLKT